MTCLPADMCDRPAYFSGCGRYRYFLRRDLDLLNPKPLLWMMQNPSKAGLIEGDATTSLACGFALRWGYGIHAAVNMFAYVETDPAKMPDLETAIGPDNDDAIRMALDWVDELGGDIITAWGVNGNRGGQADRVLRMLYGRPLLRLGVNSNGSPRFPRAILKTSQPEKWAA